MSKSSYNITLLNCLPGSCRTTPFISRSKSVARTSEEFKPEFSSSSSMCLVSSTFSSSYSFFSEPPRAAAASRFRCSASGRSTFNSAARTGRGQFLDYIFRVDHQLGALLDQQVGREAHWLGDIPRHAKNLPAKLHRQ